MAWRRGEEVTTIIQTGRVGGGGGGANVTFDTSRLPKLAQLNLIR